MEWSEVLQSVKSQKDTWFKIEADVMKSYGKSRYLFSILPSVELCYNFMHEYNSHVDAYRSHIGKALNFIKETYDGSPLLSSKWLIECKALKHQIEDERLVPIINPIVDVIEIFTFDLSNMDSYIIPYDGKPIMISSF